MTARANLLLERDEPRARLEAALTAARRRQGRILSLEGEAGIGKSSLALDFVEAHREDARVYVGGCENLSTPEPLGPLRDIARESRGRFTLSSGGRLATYESLLRLLTGGTEPALLVLEDIHWADEATLDMLRFLARRIRNESVLVLVTFRNEEPDSRARLAALWGDLPRDGCERVELSALSIQAVSSLAGVAGHVGREVFDATGGNPFHVTEYLATAPGVPASVQAATIARAAALTPHGRRTLDCAAIFPRHIDEATLVELAGDREHAGVEECLRSGMLRAHSQNLSFRHELARRAVYEAMSPLRRRDLHAKALEMLSGRPDVTAAEAAHHAEHAGARDELVRHSVRAADEAGKLGAHRQAVAHLQTALDHGADLPEAARAGMLEKQALSAEFCGDPSVAISAINETISTYRRSGDSLGLGNALRLAARIWWMEGHSEVAEACSSEALQILSEHADSWQYAMALSGQSQLDTLADRNEASIARARQAMEYAERLGRSDIYVHALTNRALATTSLDPDKGFALMEAAAIEAKARNELDGLPRLYASWVYLLGHCRRYDRFFATMEEALRISVARDHSPMEAYCRGMRATALLDLGRIEEAIGEAESVVHGPFSGNIGRFPALIALSRAQIRSGQCEEGWIEQARSLPSAQRDIMRVAYIAIADAEAHWLGHDRGDSVGRLGATVGKIVAARTQPWTLAETAFWLSVLGGEAEIPDDLLVQLDAPFRLHLKGEWQAAAAAWAELGAPYEQALSLSMGNEADQRKAVALFDRIGAAPAANKLRRDLRQRGVRSVPTGPREARRRDPLGLTPRQNQVLFLLAEGLSNGEIAERLTTSAKTVEHHVGAILATLEAPNRLRAVQVARERGILGH